MTGPMTELQEIMAKALWNNGVSIYRMSVLQRALAADREAGWVWVPREPTSKMLEIGYDKLIKQPLESLSLITVYKAMLKAADDSSPRTSGAVILDKEQAEVVRGALQAADQDTHEYWGPLVKEAIKLLEKP